MPRDSIIADLNLDMVGRGAPTDVTGKNKEGQELFGAENYLQLVGSRRLSTELGDIVEQVNTTEKMPFKFDYSMDANGHPQNIYCRSDHANYARFGIPVDLLHDRWARGLPPGDGRTAVHPVRSHGSRRPTGA